jgi:hypothetical protein
MRQPLVTVSIPYHGCPGQIRRAVAAVLAQTMPDLLCVVTNDADRLRPPWPHLHGLHDPRLVFVDRAVNRGRYFADAVVLAATTTPWWTVHDADDAAAPDWLETMLAVDLDVDVVQTAQRVVDMRGVGRLEPVRPEPYDRAMHHYAHMAGLWRTEWLREVGGPHPGYRVGYDTLLSTVARGYGRVAIVPTPAYTRYRRPGSLTTSRATGGRSAYRQQQRARLQNLWSGIAATCSTTQQVGALVRSQDRPTWAEAAHEGRELAKRLERNR